jgi:hypothetical protein
LVKKKRDRLTAAIDGDTSWQDRELTDDRLESMVNQLLDSAQDSESGDLDAAADDLLDARNDGSQAAAKTLGEKEIDSLLERMVFSEQAFLKYSH